MLQAERPLEALAHGIDQAKGLLGAIEQTLQSSGLPLEHRDTFDKVQAILTFTSRAGPLAEADLLGVLSKSQHAKALTTLLSQRLAEASLALIAAQERASPWRDPLSPDDTRTALAQARSLENSLLRFLRPSYWRLKKHAARPV